MELEFECWVYPKGDFKGEMLTHKDCFGMCPKGNWWQYADQGFHVNEEGKEKEFELRIWTGIKDKNGTKIFQGDILKRYKKNGDPYNKITIAEGPYEGLKTLFACLESAVIGNIHQNPELLK